MRLNFSVLLKFGAVVLGVALLSNSARADIPKRINFQGVLKDTLGNPLPDGNYSLTFRIYDAASGGNVLWQEAGVFALSGGLLTHILGSFIPVPESVFSDSLRWLGIQVGADEIVPRRQLVSVAYAYVADFAQNADKLDGLNSTDFVNLSSDYGRSGVAPDLYEGAATLTSKYVNVTGPDSVVATSGASFYGRSAGSSASDIIGVKGFGQNTG